MFILCAKFKLPPYTYGVPQGGFLGRLSLRRCHHSCKPYQIPLLFMVHAKEFNEIPILTRFWHDFVSQNEFGKILGTEKLVPWNHSYLMYALISGINVFDCLHIIFAIMESFRLTFDNYYPNFLLSTFPWFHFPMYRITLVGSIYMMIATAIERYLAVCAPHTYHEMNSRPYRCLYYIIPVTLVAVLVNVPKFFETRAEWR